ncbi:molecular chaperone Tir [Pseudonocardia sulfidoxydans NBRC 16205]|uniref:Molecular chaperone Tir n=1 Tax=Pseudonocardia sulfidoxydans NBRC 16205 TaxID=1223511 RepID=A0A511DAB2_9PSEU|nr:TIR domain-containing protein [Pseudonocardia sulfidoxydans]GEL21711.1 molecular chaperone Tir [Pseudonocardia sulfidoxydans NBRC 16205]
MSYRNKTYVAFASEDITHYYLMKAWRANKKIDFNFFDAHEMFKALDTSQRETIKRRLRERLVNTAKQVVLLGTRTGKRKGGDGYSFLAHEVDLILELNLPVVVANLDGSRRIEENVIPKPLLDASYYTVSVSFEAAIIKHALDGYVSTFRQNQNLGPHYYKPEVYRKIGL